MTSDDIYAETRRLRKELTAHGWNIIVDKSYRVLGMIYIVGNLNSDDMAKAQAYMFMCGYEVFSNSSTQQLCEDCIRQGKHRIYYRSKDT